MMKSSKNTNKVHNLKQSFHELGHRYTNQRESIWQLFNNAPNGFTISDAALTMRFPVSACVMNDACLHRNYRKAAFSGSCRAASVSDHTAR